MPVCLFCLEPFTLIGLGHQHRGGGQPQQEDSQRRARREGDSPVAPGGLDGSLPERGGARQNGEVVEESGQILRQFARRPISVITLFGGGFQDDGFQLHRNGRIVSARRHRFVAGDLRQQGVAVLAIEQRFQGEQLVQCRTQRIDISPVIHHPGAGQGLFGAGIAQCAQNLTGAGEAGILADAGKAKISHPQIAMPIEQQVGGLDVAVDHAHLVGLLQRTSRLGPQFRYPAMTVADASRLITADGKRYFPGGMGSTGQQGGNRGDCRLGGGICEGLGGADGGSHRSGPAFVCLGSFGAQGFDQHGQALALDELHGIEMHAALHAHRKNGHDVVMAQVGSGQRLVTESFQLPMVQGGSERQHLQRHAAAQGHLFGLVHHSHATAAHLAQQPEIPQGPQRQFVAVAGWLGGGMQPGQGGVALDKLGQIVAKIRIGG